MLNYILICSDQYRERKEESIKFLNMMGIDKFYISESQFPNNLPEDFDNREYIGSKSLWGLGKYGCYLAWEKALDFGLSLNTNFVVFEDDFKPVNSYVNKLYIEKFGAQMVHEDLAITWLGGDFRRSNKFVITCCHMFNCSYVDEIINFRKGFYGAGDKILGEYLKRKNRNYHKEIIFLQSGRSSIIRERNKICAHIEGNPIS